MAIVSANGAATPLSPNYLINADFNVNQRNFSSSTTAAYGFDRWVNNTDGTGATFSAQTFPLGAAPVQGQEAKNFLQVTTTGQSSANTYTIFGQRVEDVRTLAGQTVTVSFWAKAASGTPKIAVEIEQYFGSGGSAPVDASGGAITINTNWTRYSTVVALPSISGKTIGANSFLELNLWTSAGSTYSASRASSIGIQSATIAIWGVQLEAGSIATPFRRNANSLQGELAACQRYFERIGQSSNGNGSILGQGIGISSTQVRCVIRSSVPKRVGPVLTYNPGSTIRLWDGTNLTGAVTGMTQYNAATTLNGDCLVDFTTSSVNQYRPYFVIPANDYTGTFDMNAEL